LIKKNLVNDTCKQGGGLVTRETEFPKTWCKRRLLFCLLFCDLSELDRNRFDLFRIWPIVDWLLKSPLVVDYSSIYLLKWTWRKRLFVCTEFPELESTLCDCLIAQRRKRDTFEVIQSQRLHWIRRIPEEMSTLMASVSSALSWSWCHAAIRDKSACEVLP
jgi:hypothetical protein